MTRPGKPNSRKRRFIAGAVCPECRCEDRIVVEPTEQGHARVCVNCGFSETLEERAPQVPRSRLERNRTQVPDAPVKIIDR